MTAIPTVGVEFESDEETGSPFSVVEERSARPSTAPLVHDLESIQWSIARARRRILHNILAGLGTVRRVDRRAWNQGPVFEYRASSNVISVDVTGSSWPIRGVTLAAGVLRLLRLFRGLPGRKILDFGAGSWLRYCQYARTHLPAKELFAVEYQEAFHDDAAAIRQAAASDVEVWRPVDFVRNKRVRFDLVLLINVLNTIPEESHRQSIFSALADRLNPNGQLLVYQRIWAESENPAGAIAYGDGWFVPQPHHSHYTFRASTGRRWFTEQASRAELRALDAGRLSSANTLLRLWEKRF